MESETDVLKSDLKYCKKAACRKPLSRRKGEARNRFIKRVYCDGVCLKTDPDLRKAQSDKYTQAREAETRTCKICSGSFHRGKGESRSVFSTRPTCSKQCAGKKNSQMVKEKILSRPKTCQNADCGKTFYRRAKSETWNKFEKRKTCSEPCAHALRRSLSKHSWQKKSRRSTSEPERKLPPVSPTSIDIPDAPVPQPRVVEVWRPASWGGSYMKEVS